MGGHLHRLKMADEQQARYAGEWYLHSERSDGR